MLSLLCKSILAVLFPGGLIFLIAIGFLRPQGLPMWLQQPIAALPYIVLTFGLIFGWYFASSRMILSLLVLALADRALVLFSTTDADQAALSQTIVAISAFLVPLNLLAFSILKEDSLSTLRGLTRVVLVLVQPFLLLWLCLPNQQNWLPLSHGSTSPRCTWNGRRFRSRRCLPLPTALLLRTSYDSLFIVTHWRRSSLGSVSHFRGLSYEPLRLATDKFFHGGRTDSLRHIASILLSADLPRRTHWHSRSPGL